jgi:hypothetical protein
MSWYTRGLSALSLGVSLALPVLAMAAATMVDPTPPPPATVPACSELKVVLPTTAEVLIKECLVSSGHSCVVAVGPYGTLAVSCPTGVVEVPTTPPAPTTPTTTTTPAPTK